MKSPARRSLLAALFAVGGAALYAKRKAARARAIKNDPVRSYMTYFALPLWLGTGLIDYFWHRRTKIETTSGPGESFTHVLMMAEGAPAILAGLFLEINAGTIAIMLASSVAHQLTAMWDVSFTAPRRVILAREQHTHSFMEMAPFCIATTVICMNWNQFLALFGQGPEPARFAPRLRRPLLPARHTAAILGACAVFGLPHVEELWRCLQAQRKGLTGRDTPECTVELFGDSFTPTPAQH
jgi:hypothetical protein